MKTKLFPTFLTIIFSITMLHPTHLVYSIYPVSNPGKISGFITDKETGQPIPDANIFFLDTHIGTASQDGGYYFIDKIHEGTYDITVRVMGYQEITKERIVIGKNTILNFSLTPEAIQFDPIMVTATRSDHLQSMVTVASEVLTPQRIKEQTGNTVGEVTESLGGLYTRNYDGLAGPQTPSIRGSNTDQVLILLDDQRLNTAQGGGVDLNVFPVEVIERIEVVKGGHSALLGTDAIGGVIHLVSKESLSPKGFSYGIHSTMGSFGTRMVTLYGSHQMGPLSYFLSYNKTNSDGDFTYKRPSDTGEEEKRENNDYAGHNLFLKTKLDMTTGHQLRLFLHSLQTKRGVVGSVEWPSHEARRNENRKLFSLHSENQLSSRWRLREQIYYNTYDNHYMNPGGWIPEDDLHENKAFGIDVQAQWNTGQILTLITGGELRQDKLFSTKFDEKMRNTMSAFIQGEINHSLSVPGFTTQWKWVPALRWSRYSDVDTRTCPKLGLLITTGDLTSFALKGNIGQSYRVPTFNDLYWPEDDFTKGNPDLLPETSTNVDIGLVFRSNRSSHLRIETTYFQNHFDDLILWEPGADWKWTPRNLGKALIKGVENHFTLRLPGNKTYIKIGHTFMKATDEAVDSPNQGNRLIYRPDSKLDISTGLNTGPISINLNYRIVGKRFTNPDNSGKLPEYQIFNGNIGSSFSIGKIRLNVKFQALNLLNKSVYLLDGYPLPGREYRVSAGFEY